VPLPATDDTVAGYLAELADAGLQAATIARRLVVISQAHTAADLPSPTTSSLVRRVHAGVRRTIGTAQPGKAPAVVADLRNMLEKVPATRVGLTGIALYCCLASPPAPFVGQSSSRSTSAISSFLIKPA
jgi:hypothetical protein